MITSNANKLSATMGRRGENYLKEVAGAIRKNTRLVYIKARQFSQRRFASLDDLRKMGRPYAAKHPGRPPVRAHIINKQLGKFHRSWHWNFAFGRTQVKGTVWNATRYGKYFTARGTKFMIARPILEETIKRTQQERDQNIKVARGRAYRPEHLGGL